MFENTSASTMESWLADTPVLEARGSEKFELGKARAIYGTQPRDYAIMTYGIQGAELLLHHLDGIQTGHTGEDEIKDVFERVSRMSSGSRQTSMVDYADFNIQHSLEMQSVVFRALRIAGSGTVSTLTNTLP
ncbi:Uncharacterized protein FKW44_018984 [Caligus rogercresseyi]|uniref:Uncharacterized protein n=1 Tax=Caligus rogercresseyi TaxID=217165 RepID=A0A7T8GV92_CALRO|nr:Uncharacterized protein FKW44_018984 [Caligus rogercresseyi]